ncbi:MAG: SAM-dependent methyltransferase [Bacteroidetes bacterium]|nr:SAM-dependent methyltransferase [Bacteroidota bacterium]
MELDANFWESNYQNQQTGWDIGYAATPIKEYIDQLQNKNLKILIPGAGNAYEVEYLFKKGFKNVFLMDIAESPINNFKKRLPEFPENHILQEDFFNHKDKYDLIIEHTFFCALDKKLRPEYVKKMHSLLKTGGKLCGLLFRIDFGNDHPPYGGSKEEYIQLFKDHFVLKTLETAYNSIKPRMNNELFMSLIKK